MRSILYTNELKSWIFAEIGSNRNGLDLQEQASRKRDAQDTPDTLDKKIRLFQNGSGSSTGPVSSPIPID